MVKRASDLAPIRIITQQAPQRICSNADFQEDPKNQETLAPQPTIYQTNLNPNCILAANGQRKFPPNFMFGAATSSYQIEGAWNVSGRGQSDWDKLVHSTPSSVIDGSNADIACDSYHLWQQDINIIQDLGLQFYRFSISWSRILPSGLVNKVNKDGVEYYNKVINGLIAKGIEPVITMYHHDMPQKLRDLGGWLNPQIADWFKDYAAVLFSLYADRVKIWITINEPLVMCDFTYNYGIFPPEVKEPDLAPFICNKNMVIAHAKAWRFYDVNYRSKYNGMLAMANNAMWIEPATDKDIELAELAREFGIGRFSHPIYSKEGGWPPSIVKHMAEYSKSKGYPYSLLPSFSQEEIKLVQGTHDFYSLNYYSALLIRPAEVGEAPGVWFVNGSQELNAILFNDPSWPVTPFYDFAIVPEGLRRQVAWIHQRYDGVKVMISENGYADDSSDLYDEGRVEFIRAHLEQVLLSIEEDGTNIFAYTFWSLMDNFEWTEGYGIKFGLYQVDFQDPKRTRTPRVSAHFYKHLVKNHALDVPPFVHEMLRNKPTDNSVHLHLGDYCLVLLCSFSLLSRLL